MMEPGRCPTGRPSPLQSAVVVLECTADAAADCIRAVGASGWVVEQAPGAIVLLDDRALANAIAGVATSLDKQAKAVVIWRGSGPSNPPTGLTLVRRARPVGSLEWGSGKVLEESEAARVATLSGKPDVDVLLRALMRRREDPTALLGEALEVLGLDVDLASLDPALRPASAVHVEALPNRRARFSAARSLARNLRPGWLRRAAWAVPLTISAQFWIRLLYGVAAHPTNPHHLATYAALGAATGAVGVFELRRGRSSQSDPRNDGVPDR